MRYILLAAVAITALFVGCGNSETVSPLAPANQSSLGSASSLDYMTKANEIIHMMPTSDTSLLTVDNIGNSGVVSEFDRKAREIDDRIDEYSALTPPPAFASLHYLTISAFEHCREGMYLTARFMESGSTTYADEATSEMQRCTDGLIDANLALGELNGG